MKVFSSIGHFFATIGHGLAKAAKVTAQAIPVAEPLVEGVSAVLLPAAVPVERMAFALLGNAVAAASDTSAVIDAKGLNLQLDLQLVAELKALAPQFEALAAALGVNKPTNVPVTSTPTPAVATAFPAAPSK